MHKMCGIIGLIGEIEGVCANRFQHALDALSHRGPDAQAIWRNGSACLGHRRLAIIDLSDAGGQPMVDPETGLVIIFNGEIYNYKELRTDLRAKGHRFRTATDTEVLLKGFVEWGAGVLDRCNGMWAFAIWDPATRRAFLARDRFGVKPLYYTNSSRRLQFASEPKALHILDRSLMAPDANAVIDFVVNSRMHAGAQTFFKSISALPAAHYAIYDATSDRFERHRYWDYPRAEPAHVDPSTDQVKRHDEDFAELLIDAVRLRLRSDVPVGLTLSGGLDSSAVLAAARSLVATPLRCYTSIYSDAHRGEQSWAETAARYAGATVEPIAAPMDGWWATLEKIVHHMDGPGYSPAVLPLWAIAAKARKDQVPVLLEGQGADELLAGYTQYAAVAALDHLRSGRVRAFAGDLQSMRATFTSKWTMAWLGRQAFPAIVNHFTRARRLSLFHPEIVQRWKARPEDQTLSRAGQSYDPLRAALWRDHAIDVLPGLLHYGDAISMAHGIESRLPFMDYRLVEWIFRKKPPLLEDGQSKSLVRRFLHRQRFEKIAERQDKQGYPVPMHCWYRRIGAGHVADMIADTGAPIWDILQRSEIKTIAVSGPERSVRNMFLLYKLVTADIWLRQIKTRGTASGNSKARVRQPHLPAICFD